MCVCDNFDDRICVVNEAGAVIAVFVVRRTAAQLDVLVSGGDRRRGGYRARRRAAFLPPPPPSSSEQRPSRSSYLAQSAATVLLDVATRMCPMHYEFSQRCGARREVALLSDGATLCRLRRLRDRRNCNEMFEYVHVCPSPSPLLT